MFERYESNFNLDLWERINTNSIPEWLGETAPAGIEKTISHWNRKLMNESFNKLDKNKSLILVGNGTENKINEIKDIVNK